MNGTLQTIGKSFDQATEEKANELARHIIRSDRVLDANGLIATIAKGYVRESKSIYSDYVDGIAIKLIEYQNLNDGLIRGIGDARLQIERGRELFEKINDQMDREGVKRSGNEAFLAMNSSFVKFQNIVERNHTVLQRIDFRIQKKFHQIQKARRCLI